MIIMLSLNQAALLSVHLLVTCQVFAELHPDDPRNVSVPRGDSITFTCNISKAIITQISWTKGRSIFSHLMLKNKTFSNFTSRRLKINPNFPLKLIVVNTQHDDAGLYKCSVSSTKGAQTIEWNVCVTGKPEEIRPTVSVLYTFASATGLLLCCIISATCLYRKLTVRSSNQVPAQDQSPLESGGEVVPSQPRASTGRRTNNKQRSQYIERLNSIYDLS